MTDDIVGAESTTITMLVDGRPVHLTVDADLTLLDVLREELGLTEVRAAAVTEIAEPAAPSSTDGVSRRASCWPRVSTEAVSIPSPVWQTTRNRTRYSEPSWRSMPSVRFLPARDAALSS